MRLFTMVAGELRETLTRPRRLLGVLSPSRVARSLRAKRVQWLASGAWTSGAGGVAVKQFKSYDDYVRVQQSKLQHLDLGAHEAQFRTVLRDRLAASGVVAPGARVLCLGARLGGEVAAFRDLGAFAVGVDLNPGPDNPWVMFGDFQQLQFPDGVVDVVYSNSLDHAFDLTRMMAEVGRVLTAAGRLVVEADPGVEDTGAVAPDLWASLQWPTVDALAAQILACGFVLVARSNFAYPRGGTCLVFRKP
jgi:SAM-dependent methyltransferase